MRGDKKEGRQNDRATDTNDKRQALLPRTNPHLPLTLKPTARYVRMGRPRSLGDAGESAPVSHLVHTRTGEDNYRAATPPPEGKKMSVWKNQKRKKKLRCRSRGWDDSVKNRFAPPCRSARKAAARGTTNALGSHRRVFVHIPIVRNACVCALMRQLWSMGVPPAVRPPQGVWHTCHHPKRAAAAPHDFFGGRTLCRLWFSFFCGWHKRERGEGRLAAFVKRKTGVEEGNGTSFRGPLSHSLLTRMLSMTFAHDPQPPFPRCQNAAHPSPPVDIFIVFLKAKLTLYFFPHLLCHKQKPKIPPLPPPLPAA